MIDLEAFQAARPRLHSIAYRMLGSATEADDVLQDAWLRAASAGPDEPRSPEAWLTTVVTRLCLDRLKSAHATRERYVGPWLPEPVLTDPAGNQEAAAERAESITLAFLVLLETLSPMERAVFVLRQVFEYEYEDVARMLDTTAANCRQLFHRARARVAEGRPRFPASPARQRQLVERFFTAIQTGDSEGLARLLAADVTFVADGGGKATAARRPVAGRERVLRLLLNLPKAAAAAGVRPADVGIAVRFVNGEPAAVVRVAGRLDGVFVCSVEDGAVSAVRAVRNPDKLRRLGRELERATPV